MKWGAIIFYSLTPHKYKRRTAIATIYLKKGRGKRREKGKDNERERERERERLMKVFFFKVYLGDSTRKPQPSRENL